MFRVKSPVQSLSNGRRNLLRRRHERLLSTAPLESVMDDVEENPHFPNLFKPLHLGPAIGTLPNRVIMGSMHSGLEVSTHYYFFFHYRPYQSIYPSWL